jgi:hypothetical protein
MAIRDREYYLEELKKRVEGEIRLCDSNIKLLSAKETKLLGELDTITSTKREWISAKGEEEAKLANSEPWICRWLARDFQSEISERRRGGPAEYQQRYGEKKYGLKFQRSGKRTVSVPRLRTAEDGRSWYEKTDEEVQTERNNSEAFLKWEQYMFKGLEIPDTWNFDKVVGEIQKFFDGAPSLDVYGESYEVFVSSGERYEPRKAGG